MEQLLPSRRLRDHYSSLLPSSPSRGQHTRTISLCTTRCASEFYFNRWKSSLSAFQSSPVVSSLLRSSSSSSSSSPSSSSSFSRSSSLLTSCHTTQPVESTGKPALWKTQTTSHVSISDLSVIERPDRSDLLLGASADGTLTAWHVPVLIPEEASPSLAAEAGEQSCFRLHRGPLNKIARPTSKYSLNQHLIATSSDGGELNLWDINALLAQPASDTNRTISAPLLELDACPGSSLTTIFSCAFDTAGRYLASIGGNERACIFDLREGAATKPSVVVRFQGIGRDVAFVPCDDNLILTASQSGVSLWDLREHRKALQSTEAAATSRSSASDATFTSIWEAGATSAAGSGGLWSGVWGPFIPSVPRENLAAPSAISPAAVFANDTSRTTPSQVFCSRTQSYVTRFQGHHFSETIYSVLPSNTSRYALTSATDGLHKLWNLDSLEGVATLAGGAKATLPRPCLASDDSIAVSGDDAGNVHVWRLLQQLPFSSKTRDNSSLRLERVHRVPITAVALSSSLTTIFAASTLGAIVGISI